jgi:hypothetical protein
MKELKTCECGEPTYSNKCSLCFADEGLFSKQEPCGRLISDPDDGHRFIPRIEDDWSMLGQDLYTHPPKREPLTDEEMDKVLRRAGVVATFEALRCIGREVEAAHGIKEKNGYDKPI